MNISRILARFLSLMDVTLLLLGFFIILVAAASLSQEANQAKEKLGWNLIKEHWEPIWLFAACEPPIMNKCFVLNDNLSIGGEVNQSTDTDIRRLIEPVESQGKAPLIILVSEKGAFDAYWENALVSIEKSWGCPVLRIRNFPQGSVVR